MSAQNPIFNRLNLLLGEETMERLGKAKTFPKKKFLCVFSPEVLPNKGAGNPDLINHEQCSSKAQINGSSAHITAIFGFTLAGLVMNDLYLSSPPAG